MNGPGQEEMGKMSAKIFFKKKLGVLVALGLGYCDPVGRGVAWWFGAAGHARRCQPNWSILASATEGIGIITSAD